MKKSLLLLLLGLLALAPARQALAQEARSWNRSRSMANGFTRNPTGPWSFMENTSGVHDPANFRLLPDFSGDCNGMGPFPCWRDLQYVQGPVFGMATRPFDDRGVHHHQGLPMLHPGEAGPVILRWQSPVAGNVTLLARIASIDPNCCHEGITWALRNNAGMAIQGGLLAQRRSIDVLAENLPIQVGESLYFEIGINRTVWNDSTTLDLLITSQP